MSFSLIDSKEKVLFKTQKSTYYEWIEEHQKEMNARIPHRSSNYLRLATFNLHYQVDRRDNSDSTELILDAIGSVDADVLVLQEIGLYYTALLKEGLEKFGYQIVSRCKENEGLYNGIVVRALSANQLFTLDLPEDRCAIFASVVHNEKTYTIIGTHLTHKTETERMLETQSILKRIPKNSNVILAGDMNSQESSPVIEAAKEAGLRSVFKAGTEPEMTCWHGTTIDYILISEQMQSKGSYIYLSPASDHLPVLADLDCFSEG